MYDDNEMVHVAAGILRQGEKVLICQRGINRRYGLKWEFPGGRSLAGETMRECLDRELSDSLDIDVTKARELKTLQATYDDGGNFQITFFLVTSWDGELNNSVFESIEWVDVKDVPSYEMLKGSIPILEFLR